MWFRILQLVQLCRVATVATYFCSKNCLCVQHNLENFRLNVTQGGGSPKNVMMLYGGGMKFLLL